MRKQQYIATVACLVAGVIGFVSVYATDKGKERREAEQEIAAQTQQEAPASYEVKPEISVEDATKKAEEQALKLAEQEKMKQEETQQEEEKKQDEEKTVETAATVTQHFRTRVLRSGQLREMFCWITAWIPPFIFPR